MLGKVAKNVGLAPWEKEHGEEQEVDEWKKKLAARKYLTRGQWWHGYDRRVIVSDAEARNVRTTLNGRTLHLFSVDQTEEAA